MRRQWFYYFRRQEGKCALEDTLLEDKHPIGQWVENPGKHPIIRFTAFNSFPEVFRYVCATPSEKRCFFEVIRGERPQKIYFDLDYDGDVPNEVGPLILADLLKATTKAAEGLGVKLGTDDFMIFSSSTQTKSSFHVILWRYHVANHKDNAFFYGLVSTHMDDRYRPYVDKSVYSSLQQMRMLGCSKPGIDNVKRLLECFTVDSVEYRFTPPAIVAKAPANVQAYYLFENSLVTFTHTSTLLRMKQNEEKRNASFGLMDLQELSAEDVDDIMSRLTPGAFSVRSVYKNMVSLTRHKASKCVLCKRVHESDTPFIVVRTNQIFLYCHRSKAKERKSLGMLKSAVEQVSVQSSASSVEDDENVFGQLEQFADVQLVRLNR